MHAIRVLKTASEPIWEGWQHPANLIQAGKHLCQFFFSFLCLIFVFCIVRMISFICYPNTMTESPDPIRKPSWCYLGWQDKVSTVLLVSLCMPPLLCPWILLPQGETCTHKPCKLLGLPIWDASQRSFSSTHVTKEAKRESHLPAITDKCGKTGSRVPLLITETVDTDVVPCLLDPILNLHTPHLTILTVKDEVPFFYHFTDEATEDQKRS